MAATRWSPLCVFLAGGLSGAALIFVSVDRSVTHVLDHAPNTQHQQDSDPHGHAADSQDQSVGAKGDSAVTPVDEAKAAEKQSEQDAPAEVGKSLAQVLAGLEAEYRSQVSKPDLPSAEAPPAADVDAASPPRTASTSTALIADQPAQQEQEQERLAPEEAPARTVSTVAASEETGVTNEQHLVTAQIQQLAALQELAAAQQIATSQQLAVAQQLALLQYLQLVPLLVPAPPASASTPAVPQERRLPRSTFVTRFPSPKTAISSTNYPSGFYSTHSILVR
jgi:hypothetical protein